MPTDGLQPNNIEAEQAVLGAILKGGITTFEKANLTIKDIQAFYNEDHQNIWKSMQSLYVEHKNIDIVTVADEIRKFNNELVDNKEIMYYISGLFETCPSSENVEEYTKIVWKRFIKREALKSAKVLADIAEDNTKSITEVLYQHEHFAEELRQLQLTEADDISDIVHNTIDNVERKNNVIPFGLKYLDESAGGMTRGEITVLGGRPGMGKSSLMINIISKLIHNDYKVMLFNREMSNTEMMKKILCEQSNILTYNKIRKNLLNKEEHKELLKVSSFITEKYKNFYMYDNIRTLQESIQEVNKHKPDVVFDDYIQLIDVGNTLDQRRLEIGKIMIDYKWLCKKNDCSGVLISQLNRQIEQRDEPIPQMSDFAESSSIEQTAEMAVFVHYPYNTDPLMNDQYESRIIIAKSRYGKIGRHIIGFDGNKCKYYDTIDEAKAGKGKW